METALEQARRYADEQKVRAIAVSDGYMFYAADVVHGGVRDRVFISLEQEGTPEALWWLSVHGIYRDPEGPHEGPRTLLAPWPAEAKTSTGVLPGEALLHPKYRLPAACFAYVGDAADPKSWHLPYLLADHTVDGKRLPKAIQAILSNYRGARVGTIPEADIPDVLVRLARAAASIGKMPPRMATSSRIYFQLETALEQLGRSGDLAA